MLILFLFLNPVKYNHVLYLTIILSMKIFCKLYESKTAIIVYNLLSILLYQCLFSADIKYGYWAVNVHSNNRYYLIFHITEIGQV